VTTQPLARELDQIDLPKWAICDVDGPSVTPVQANEILVRTRPVYIDSNDKSFANEVDAIYYRAHPLGRQFKGEWWRDTSNFQDIQAYHEAMGLLDIYHLANHRECSAYIGGPHGWCDWDGRIHQREIRVGKWPNVSEVYDDWRQVAEAFPWLSLECRLMGHDREDPEDPDVEIPQIAVVFEVAGGEVRARRPEQADHDKVQASPDIDIDAFVARLAGGPWLERGVTLSRWSEACLQVADKMVALNTGKP
jgi:hypothetical protein